MKKIMVKETNGGTFVLSLNADETKGIAYNDYDVIQITGKDPAELTSEDLEQFDYQGCLENGNGYELLDGDQLEECVNCKTIVAIQT